MARSSGARMIISLLAYATPALPRTNALQVELNNGTGGEFWTEGRGSKNVDRVWRNAGDSVTLGFGATDSYNLLAAGGLLDILGDTVDLDELKGIEITCLTGAIAFKAPAADFLPCFGAAGDLIKLAAGHTIGISFGAGGLSLSTSGKFDIIETSGAASATYCLEFIGAN